MSVWGEAVAQAYARATAPVADQEDGWETTAAVLANEIRRLRTHMRAIANTLEDPRVQRPGMQRRREWAKRLRHG